MKAPAAGEKPRRPQEDYIPNASLEEEAGNESTIGGNPYATRNKVPLDRDDSGNGGDARGMLYHAKGGMRSAATDVVPNRHANSVSHPSIFVTLVNGRAYAVTRVKRHARPSNPRVFRRVR